MLIEKIIREIFSEISLEKDEVTFITKKFVFLSVNKGEVIIKQHEKIQHQYYVLDGCLHTYHLDTHGKEHTIQFAIKDWWISDYIALFGNQKTVFNVSCIKDSILLKINIQDLEIIYNKFPKIERFFRRKLERGFVRQEKRILSNLVNSATERYVDFLKMYPNIEKHLKNYHIASYLGITTESLSRIRKELSKK